MIGNNLNGVGDDMRFFFSEADGEMGVRSAWNVPENPYAPIQRSSPFWAPPGRDGRAPDRQPYVKSPKPTPRTYEMQGGHAAHRYGRIERALRQLDRRTVELLKAAHVEEDKNSELPRDVFGSLAVLAAKTSAAADAHQRARSDHSIEEWLKRLCARVRKARGKAKTPKPEDVEVIEAIGTEAAIALKQAESAYLHAKKGTRHAG